MLLDSSLAALAKGWYTHVFVFQPRKMLKFVTLYNIDCLIWILVNPLKIIDNILNSLNYYTKFPWLNTTSI